MKKCFYIFILITTLTTLAAGHLSAQQIEYPVNFLKLLEITGVELFAPTDAGYRDCKLFKNEFHNCQFAIRSQQENLEIRYTVIPWNEQNPATVNPHLLTFSTLTNVATNADDAVISAIRPASQSLLANFNASWGMTYFFTPKTAFSEKHHCRMTALCKEGKGTVFIFHLFDQPDNTALDTRYLALRFM